MQEETRWILCPKCGQKTRFKIKATTVMKNFPLYCHWGKTELIIDVQNFIVKVLDEK